MRIIVASAHIVLGLFVIGGTRSMARPADPTPSSVDTDATMVGIETSGSRAIFARTEAGLSSDTHSHPLTDILTSYNTFLVDGGLQGKRLKDNQRPNIDVTFWYDNHKWPTDVAERPYLSGTPYGRSTALLLLQSSGIAPTGQPYLVRFTNEFSLWAGYLKETGFRFSVVLYDSKGRVTAVHSGTVNPCPAKDCTVPSGFIQLISSPSGGGQTVYSLGSVSNKLKSQDALSACRRYLEAAFESPDIYFRKVPEPDVQVLITILLDPKICLLTPWFPPCHPPVSRQLTNIFTNYDTFKVGEGSDLQGISEQQGPDVEINLVHSSAVGHSEWPHFRSNPEPPFSGTAYGRSTALLLLQVSGVAPTRPYTVHFTNKFWMWASIPKQYGFTFRVLLLDSKGQTTAGYLGVVQPCPRGCTSFSGHLEPFQWNPHRHPLSTSEPKGLGACWRYLETAFKSPDIYFRKAPEESDSVEEDAFPERKSDHTPTLNADSKKKGGKKAGKRVRVGADKDERRK
ncbi:hypothetical protein F5878DRAFT_680801 [Lentinula raphanica]|uniref:Uncharacterized protein n=1 Tax=Lentinula raphanica TaxID=153919 RepID=A0AA38P9Z2_9AGAR|nr:hypothetical protein F5878DRAFT_680801 [Lentinula raphanica]